MYIADSRVGKRFGIGEVYLYDVLINLCCLCIIRRVD